MNRLISRREAAEILRCEEQTISNYIEWGVLKGHKIRNRIYVDSDTIECITDNVDDFSHARYKLREMKKKYEEEIEKLDYEVNQITTLRKFFGDKFPPVLAHDIVPRILYAFWDRGVIDERDYSIVKDIALYGVAYSTIAERYNLTVERVRQICGRTLRKIVNAATDMRLVEIPQKDARIKELTIENAKLKADVEILMKRLSAYEDSETTRKHLVGVTPNEIQLIGVLSRNVKEIDFTVRTMNTLIYADINTLGDLVSYKKADFMRFRNFGKKSLKEVVNVLEDISAKEGVAISLGMELPLVVRMNVLSNQKQ